MQQTDEELRRAVARNWSLPIRRKILGEDVPVYSTTINKSPLEVQSILEIVENLPLFFEFLESVHVVESNRSEWHFRNKLQPDVKVSIRMRTSPIESGWIWEPEDNAHIKYLVAMTSEPAQADRGTVVRMQVKYESLAAEIAAKFEKLFGDDAEMIAKKNLQRFKAFCETGNIPTTEGQPSGRESENNGNMNH